jgi:hypothetical protein
MFIIYEMTKKSKSFWYPYFRTMPDVEFSARWDQKDIEQFQDRDLPNLLIHYKMELKPVLGFFVQVLQKYPKIFPDHFMSRKLFLNVYGQVCTRCFGYSVPSTSMIPMADNFNHGCFETNQELICSKLHKIFDQGENKAYLTPNKIMNDYSMLFKKEKTE